MRTTPSSEPATKIGQADDSTRYVLITECLQNDLLLNSECRLSLPDAVVREVLLGKRRFEFDMGGDRRRLPSRAIGAGPLGLFLEQTIGRRRRGEDGRGCLHVINIRDWHLPDENYDLERRTYGAHCEAGTWGADYVEGLKGWLDPAPPLPSEEARYFEEGSVRIHHVHADSIYDFRPRRQHIEAGERKFNSSALEVLLDVIVQGSEQDQERARTLLRDDPRPRGLWPLAEEIDDDETVRSSAQLYVAVIGFYTDIKVQMVLSGLRSRYVIPNLAVSDTFTASASLERHLSGLDFASKLLTVEVVHGINDLVHFLGGSGDLVDEPEIVAGDRFSRYKTFFQDRQNVLAYESERLLEYELLTQRRSIQIYDTIRRANTFLIAWGMTFLAATLVLAILGAFGLVHWQLAAVTGGLSLVQFVGAFFTQPSSDLQRNLTNLAVFKMILQSHSMKTAVARFHLTTPQTLRELQTPAEAGAAERQVKSLRDQLAAIEDVDRADFDALTRLGFGTDFQNGATAQNGPTANAAKPEDASDLAAAGLAELTNAALVSDARDSKGADKPGGADVTDGAVPDPNATTEADSPGSETEAPAS
jgi:hypothetical protein